MVSANNRPPKPGNKRSAARLAAVQALYQMDISGADLFATLSEFEAFRLGKEVDGDVYRDADVAFFRDIAGGVVREQIALDPAIDGVLKEGWPLARIDSTLRQILRCGAYEIYYRRDVPARAAIVEYVDIASAFFANGEEPRIVNAILDTLGRRERAEDFSGAAPRSA
ncbi:transcription antitermination factor NusB [Candidatus Raskinella chloraquaticus]|jgi:transcription antitermination protein NusB|uniref:Transcription antitermination protein NusB n=1 Tax=Candidatus Raskinella chloraquaticus TaxID=1951219 RepID=A0A1W9HPB5_9HYPH|nr:MAG: N utilization substance protein B [Proteobacteria bacterium SG_bin8]